MSLFNDITAVVGARPAGAGASRQPTRDTGQMPGTSSPVRPVATSYNSVFTSTFSQTMATVFERGAAGEFDDQALALEEQAALQRLRVARQAAGISPPSVPSDPSDPSDPSEPRGANAAPTAAPANPATAPDATSDSAAVAVAEQRNLYAVRVRQSQATLTNMTASLKQDFPLAVQLVSASTGTWDPATFVPQTKEQAAAFAQRLVIDASEAAGRLHIIKAQLDAARFEVAQGGGAEVQQLVRDLEAGYDRQKSYAAKLARIVDGQSDGKVSKVGARARAGDSVRGAEDLPVGELAGSLLAEGMSDEQVMLLVGAGELAIEEARTPGGSSQLKAIASDMTRSLINQFNSRMREHQETFQRQEQDRAEQRRLDERRAERRRTEDRSVERRADAQRSERALAEQVQLQRASQQDAAFQRWLQQLSAQSNQRRAG